MNEPINCFSNDTLIQMRQKTSRTEEKKYFHFRWEDLEPTIMNYIATTVIIPSRLAGELRTTVELWRLPPCASHRRFPWGSQAPGRELAGPGGGGGTGRCSPHAPWPGQLAGTPGRPCPIISANDITISCHGDACSHSTPAQVGDGEPRNLEAGGLEDGVSTPPSCQRDRGG